MDSVDRCVSTLMADVSWGTEYVMLRRFAVKRACKEVGRIDSSACDDAGSLECI
jgi:hypothetical protein